jgi:hypothetical protein
MAQVASRIAHGAGRIAHRASCIVIAKLSSRIAHGVSARFALAQCTPASCTGIVHRSRASRLGASSSAIHASRVVRRRAHRE